MKTFYKFFLIVATISLCSCINEDVNLQTEAIGESYEAHIEMKDFKTSLINAAKNKSSDSVVRELWQASLSIYDAESVIMILDN